MGQELPWFAACRESVRRIGKICQQAKVQMLILIRQIGDFQLFHEGFDSRLVVKDNRHYDHRSRFRWNTF